MGVFRLPPCLTPAEMAFHPARDLGLRRLECSHLFAENQTLIAARRGHLLRRYAYRFMALCAPHLTEAIVVEALAAQSATESATKSATAPAVAPETAPAA